MSKVGFKPCGVIHNGIIYNDHLQDLILNQLSL